METSIKLTESQTWEALNELALDLRWSWNHASDELWAKLHAELWELTRNPWLVLQSASRAHLATLVADPEYRRAIDRALQSKRELESRPLWFQQCHPEAPLNSIAYFCMEFMLSEALPIYSGGLGNVAGDQLKSASDLGVPVVGIGLLYQQGYFRQEISAAGEQQELYPFNEPAQMPIQPVRNADGEWLRLAVEFPGRTVWVRPWQVKVGRVKLYLLDTNDPGNLPGDRSITSELYGGGLELRLKQEILLGIGGWRLLHALGIEPDVCHLNEGHAAFVALERARCWMVTHRQPFRSALAATRAGNLFTTHTSVEAGFDRYPAVLMKQYLADYSEQALGIPFEEFLNLGRVNPNEPFNMAYLAVRCSAAVNGVSRLHGEVSRRLFQKLFPRWPEAEVPVTHVTNGVHMPTWDSKEADRLWTSTCGKERWLGTLAKIEADLRRATDEELWETRTQGRHSLVEFSRRKLEREWAARGLGPEDVAGAVNILDRDTLTLGFARRFAKYKRPNLLLYDQDRLIQILNNAHRPVQIIVAGKAHPKDGDGHAMIRQWMDFVRRPEVRRRAVFLSNYDMLLADQLIHGVDVWINTPLRPWEASGTSGMKILVNGGLNLSVLDGWWAEAYSADVGWAIGNDRPYEDRRDREALDAAMLYDTLEREVIPQFYERPPNGIPKRWVARIRESMARLTPAFSANRSVREYTEDYYLRLSSSYRARSESGGAAAASLREWQAKISEHWSQLRFGPLHTETRGGTYLFETPVHFDKIEPEDVQVELYADARGSHPSMRREMTRGKILGGSGATFLYSANVPADRPISDYTPRIIPSNKRALVPLESAEIFWQR